MGLSRACFGKDRLREDSMSTARAAAAFRFLLDHNRFYAVFFKQHCAILASGGSLKLSGDRHHIQATTLDEYFTFRLTYRAGK